MEYVRRGSHFIAERAKRLKDEALPTLAASLEGLASLVSVRGAKNLNVVTYIYRGEVVGNDPIFGGTYVHPFVRTEVSTVGTPFGKRAVYFALYDGGPSGNSEVDYQTRLVTADEVRQHLEALLPDMPITVFGMPTDSVEYQAMLDNARSKNIKPFFLKVSNE